jgi:hypothetical protein
MREADGSFDFQGYRRSVAQTYEKWQQLYTLTDAESRERRSQESAPFFDFGLFRQTGEIPESLGQVFRSFTAKYRKFHYDDQYGRS